MIDYAHIRVCKELVRTDLLIFKKELLDKCFDLMIWVTLSLTVVNYILPQFGLSATFGLFQLGSVFATVPLFEMYGNVATLIADFQTNRIIDYHLTLPIPSWMAIISKVAYYFTIYLFLAACTLPVGKLCLWHQLDLTQINYLQLLLACIFQALFYACFILVPVSFMANLSKMRTVWARYIYPMWITGGFQFSWFALYALFPHVAYIVLLNPLIYITESLRIALLGQEGFINFWLCLCMITVYAMLALFIGLRTLKKKLDYV